MLSFRLIASLLFSLIVAGCTSVAPQSLPVGQEEEQSGSQTAGVTTAEAEVEPKVEPEPILKPFPENTLYDLLVGDIALIRGQYGLGLDKYLKQGRETRDPGVLEMAHRVASHLRNDEAMIEAALLWVEADSQNVDARRAALQGWAMRREPLQALEHGYWLYRERDDLEALLSVTGISFASEMAAPLLQAYRDLPLAESGRAELMLVEALLLRKMGEEAQAAQAAKSYLAARPGDVRAILVMAQLLQEQAQLPAALELLDAAIVEQPDQHRLRLQYARYLISQDRALAIEQLEVLRGQTPEDEAVMLLLGMLYMDRGELDAAREQFGQINDAPGLRADAQYQLGRIEEREGEAGQALVHYRQVRSGRNFLAAASRVAQLVTDAGDISAARIYLQNLRSRHNDQSAALFQMESNLLVGAQQPAQAFDILSQGLAQHPNNIELLYARSMVAEQRDQFSAAEQDLRAILALDNQNATALNALGYTMLIHTDRIDEAYELIQRAYQLEPGDPAIMDSLGWALYRKGDAEGALEYLQKAMAIFPDPEVASHLGEVQWVLGEHEAARDTWRRGLEQVPESPKITDTLRRLGVDLEL